MSFNSVKNLNHKYFINPRGPKLLLNKALNLFLKENVFRKAVVQLAEQSLQCQKVCVSIPGPCILHVKMFLSKMLNPNLRTMCHQCANGFLSW